jgi:hypothetical protein
VVICGGGLWWCDDVMVWWCWWGLRGGVVHGGSVEMVGGDVGSDGGMARGGGVVVR